jgi:tryptophan 7-halogenase
MKKNIVIVGGGTAGWLTALYSQKNFPEHKTILIESSKIGILGAGESTTPPLVKMLEYLDIPVSLLIKETKATIKNTIKFTNWSADSDYYYNSFSFKNNHMNHKNIDYENWSGIPLHHIISMEMNEKNTEFDFIGNLVENNITLFRENEFKNRQMGEISNLYSDAFYALHVDARLLADLFRKIGKDRGIITIDAVVDNFNLNQSGDIESIKLDTGEVVGSDFVFDCSGFARLIIGNLYKSKWKSFSHILPMKKAIPFFVDIKDSSEIVPYSESIAMNYGWMWKVPLQHRYGCGYVFDSDYISVDDAKIELENKVGHEINVPKVFDFDAGSYSDIWINNSIALGLSAGFVEPLEATALLQFQETIEKVFINKEKLFINDKEYIKRFNKTYNDEIDSIVDYVYLHYMTDKTNTPFWKNFTINNKIPDTLSEKVYYLNNEMLMQDVAGHKNTNIFDTENYFVVARGINLINKENMHKNYIKYNLSSIVDKWKEHKVMQTEMYGSYKNHSTVLKTFGGLQNE